MDDNSSQPHNAWANDLWRAFLDPPDPAHPRAWWHWMDGNIDPDGVVRDLTWLHSVGVRGAQLFEGGMGVPLVVPEPVRPGTAAWENAVATATRTAADLGMELAVATSSGWSAAGGPWVRPADAMKKLVWSETVVQGDGSAIEVALVPLPDVAGAFLDSPRWATPSAERFAVDWIVLVLPHRSDSDALRADAFWASAPVADWAPLTDGSFGASIALPRDPDGWSEAWVEQSFDKPVTVRSVVVGLPGPRGFGAAPPPTAILQASDDGLEYWDVMELSASTVPARTASFPAVTARRFRLLLAAGSAADALPPVAEGVRLPPVLRTSQTFVVTEFVLRAAGRVHQAEVKAGFGVIPDYYAADTASDAAPGAIDNALVVDVTDHVHDGVLRWDAPPGRWRVLRLGASLTGQTNGPAPADTTGLEVDKLDGRRVADYLKTHLERFEVGADADLAGWGFSALLSDSIESGPQNWTDDIREHFQERRGYDPLLWLPALAGWIIDSPAESDRFLYDYRRTVAELLADEYYGTLAAEAHRRGMTYYAEALEDGRPQLGDDLAMRSHADVPMGAMWTFEPDAGPLPTYVADLKGASSTSHVYGKSWTGSEAFSSFGNPWVWTPRTLKHVADLQLSLGVTRFCIHTSAHQPLAVLPPGIALTPSLGQSFTVNETWAGMAGPWIDYLSRCSAVLSAGEPAMDFAVFIGEESPVTGLFGAELDNSVPPGFDFDYVGPDALATVLRVEDGLVVSAGARYRLLFLGGSSARMSVTALVQLERLLDAGATIVGARPISSPSLGDSAEAFRDVCDRIWAKERHTGFSIQGDLSDAVRQLGIRPTFEIEGGPVRRIGRIVDGRPIIFLANPSADEVQVRVVAPDGSANLVGWDPVGVCRTRLDRAASAVDDRRAFTVALAPFGSLFVLDDGLPLAKMPSRRRPLDGEWHEQLPGHPSFVTTPDPRPWTERGDRAQTFSGVGVYRHDFFLTADEAGSAALFLEIDAVRDIARVVVNGQDCGVAWTLPFRVDVSSAVKAAHNRVEIHVATPWRNRLIMEAAAPSGEIFAPMTEVFDPAASTLQAGLIGAVSLLVFAE